MWEFGHPEHRDQGLELCCSTAGLQRWARVVIGNVRPSEHSRWARDQEGKAAWASIQVWPGVEKELLRKHPPESSPACSPTKVRRKRTDLPAALTEGFSCCEQKKARPSGDWPSFLWGRMQREECI